MVSVRGSGRGRVRGRDPAPRDAPGPGGGRGGDGGLRLPSGKLGYGRWAWDTTLGPICLGNRASGLSLQIPSFVLKDEALGELRELLTFFFLMLCVSLALALVEIVATLER